MHSPFLAVFLLVGIEASVLFLSSRKHLKKFFHYIPAVFWIYFLPMIASTTGLLVSDEGLYRGITDIFLPLSLVMLLSGVDIPAIAGLGRQALLMMLAGSLGIVLATPLVFYLVKDKVGSQMWQGFGALSGSWIGGSANMIAVKEAIGATDAVFTPMIIVDTIVPYIWMAVLVAGSVFQERYDRWNKSEFSFKPQAEVEYLYQQQPFKLKDIIAVAGIGVIGLAASDFIAKKIPPCMFNLSGLRVIIASCLGIIFSFTPLRKLERVSNKIGYFLLFFVLTTIGAKAKLTYISSAAVLIGAGFLIVLVHVILLFLFSRLIKAPLFLIAVSSQANIGGVASAPVVASVYQPALTGVGLLLAVLGNIVGTYLGIITAYLCRWAANM